MIIYESYYGRNEATDYITDVFSRLLSITEKDPHANGLLKELEFALKKFCGATFYVDVDKDAICYTIPVRYTKPPTVKVTNEGIKFITPNECLIMITYSTSLIFKQNSAPNLLSSEELTAITLHEIAHNFFNSVLPLGNALEGLKAAISLKTKTKMKLAIGGRKTEDNDISRFVRDVAKIIKNDRRGFLNGLSDAISIGAKNAFARLLPGQDVERYVDEKFADSFATVYGYGPELASALKKIEHLRGKYEDKQYGMLSYVSGMIAIGTEFLFDDHPNLMSRMTLIIDNLEFELNTNKSIDKKTKANLNKQIRETKAMMKQYMNLEKSSKYDIPKKLYISAIMSIIPNNIEGDIFGNLVKDLFNPDIMDVAMKK